MYYKYDCLLFNRSCMNRNANTNNIGNYVSLNRMCITK